MFEFASMLLPNTLKYPAEYTLAEVTLGFNWRFVVVDGTNPGTLRKADVPDVNIAPDVAFEKGAIKLILTVLNGIFDISHSGYTLFIISLMKNI